VRNDSVDQSEEVMAVIYPGNMSAGMTNIKTVRNKSVGLNEPSRNTDENLRLYQACTSVRRYTSLYGDCVHPDDFFFNYTLSTLRLATPLSITPTYLGALNLSYLYPPTPTTAPRRDTGRPCSASCSLAAIEARTLSRWRFTASAVV
jgi:hypothetical protein